MESVIARVLKDPKQSENGSWFEVHGSWFGGRRGVRLLRFARNDWGRSVKGGYAKLSSLI